MVQSGVNITLGESPFFQQFGSQLTVVIPEYVDQHNGVNAVVESSLALHIGNDLQKRKFSDVMQQSHQKRVALQIKFQEFGHKLGGIGAGNRVLPEILDQGTVFFRLHGKKFADGQLRDHLHDRVVSHAGDGLLQGFVGHKPFVIGRVGPPDDFR